MNIKIPASHACDYYYLYIQINIVIFKPDMYQHKYHWVKHMRYTFLLMSQCLLLKSFPYRDDEYIRFDMFNRRMKDAPTLLMGIWYGIIFTFQNVSMYR